MPENNTDDSDDFNIDSLFAAMGSGPIEPSSDLQGAMGELFQAYTAAVRSGFTEVQAMSMVNTMVRASFGG